MVTKQRVARLEKQRRKLNLEKEKLARESLPVDELQLTPFQRDYLRLIPKAEDENVKRLTLEIAKNFEFISEEFGIKLPTFGGDAASTGCVRSD